MKNLFKLSVDGLIFLFMMLLNNSYAQEPDYWCYAKNDTLLNAKDYQFDVYISSQTGPELYLSSYQLTFTIDKYAEIINGGKLSGSYVAESSQLPEIFKPVAVDIPLLHHFIKINGPPPESDTGVLIPPYPGIRIGTFKISNIANFGESNIDLKWRHNPESDSTYIYAIVPPSPTGIPTDISNPSFHVDYFTDPILNAEVIAYNMESTNNGGYCYGDHGVRVGLSGSQSGVLYRLIKNDTCGRYVSLNPDSLNYFPSFQKFGVYSSSAYREATYLSNDMQDTVTIVEYPLFKVGFLKGDTTICYNTQPDQLTGTTPSGGNTPYGYQWQNSTDNINFNNIEGATNLNYQPDVLTETTYYQQIQTSASGCGSDTSNIVTITVYPPLTVPLIADIQTICAGERPVPLYIKNPPGGGSGVYLFQWESSENQTTWHPVTGAVNDTFQPLPLNQSTYYRLKISTSPDCGSVTSAAIKITVKPLPEPATISGDINVCKNQFHALYSVNTVQGYSYSWHLGNDMGSFEAGQGTNKTYIHWGNASGTDTLYLTQTDVSTNCSIESIILIHILGKSAPDTTSIIRKPNSNMLVCADTSDGIKYQWGFNTMNPDTGKYISGATLRYVFLNEFNTSYNYFVDTYYENLGACTTRSYLNPYVLPIGLDEYMKAESNPMIFPNPSNSVVNILLPDYYLKTDLQVRLLDLTGRLNFNASVSPSRIISLALPSCLRQGFYILQLFSAANPVFSTRLSIIK